MIRTMFIRAALCLAVTALSNGAASAAQESHEGHHENGDAAGHDHSNHNDHDHAPPKTSTRYELVRASYTIPALSLTNQYGEDVRLDRLLSEDRPTLVQFVFTSCTTICPVMGAVFGGAQADIAGIAPNYRMVSISIDPEYDTPERLREFAAKQNANPDWIMLTGSKEAITQATKAFDALYQGDNKMYHQPYTFIRWQSDKEWTRIRGLLSVADLVEEFSAAKGTAY